MKNHLKITGLLLFVLLFAGQSLMAQGSLLKKIKARAEDEIVDEIWLVLYKKGFQKGALNLDEAVEEALCYGWIDSTLKNRG